MSDTLRITGIMSGMDTETMIKDLMKAESLKMDALEQQKKLAEWEKESYQDISKMLREFRDTYMDILTPATNFRSPSMFANFTSSIMTAGGVETSAVSVTGNATATDLTHTIGEISQLATADKYSSKMAVKDSIVGSDITDASSLAAINQNITDGLNTFSFSLDGTTKTITLDGSYTTLDGGASPTTTLIYDLNEKLEDAFGANKVTASFIGDKLTFSSPESGHQMQVFASDAEILGNLGFETGDASFVKTSETLESAFGIAAGSVALEINGVTDFGIESTDTVKEMMDKINNSNAGVEISFSSLTGEFSIESNETGVVNQIDFGTSDNLFLKEKILNLETGTDTYETVRTAGQDAQFELDGVTTSRSSNNFTIDGLTYTLNRTHAAGDPIEISLTRNTEELKENIGGFVEKFNEIIKTVNDRLGEKRYYDYKPLTDEQKEAMSEDDIELWNEKAKSGILRGSNELQTFANNLRRLVYEPVEGVDITLRDIGITTSTNYKDNGKLVVDEAKLESALQNNFDKVVDLFTKTSEIDYEDADNRTQRYNESGFANRLYDLVQDNVRNTRDANGKRGILIEKAGFEGELSDLQNTIQTRIGAFDDRIDDMMDYLNSREEYYYQMFARMESALAEMDSQGQWLQSQLGGM